MLAKRWSHYSIYHNMTRSARVEEKDTLIVTLQKELDKAGQREEDLKETHRNYMLQMQTLINQKAIEAPGAKRYYEFNTKFMKAWTLGWIHRTERTGQGNGIKNRLGICGKYIF
jgi:hypothetical protein